MSMLWAFKAKCDVFLPFSDHLNNLEAWRGKALHYLTGNKMQSEQPANDNDNADQFSWFNLYHAYCLSSVC